LFNIFLHRERDEVTKHDHTQTQVAHNWLSRSGWNNIQHAAKGTPYALIYINEMPRCQFVHRKISTLTFRTDGVCNSSIFPFLYAFTLTTLTIQTHLLLPKYRHRILLCTCAPHIYHIQTFHLLGYPATPAMLQGTTKLTPVSITVRTYRSTFSIFFLF